LEQEQDKPKRRQEPPWMKVVAIWLHKYQSWRSRLEHLKDRGKAQPQTTPNYSGMPGGGRTPDNTSSIAIERLEDDIDYHALIDRVRIVELGLRAMKDKHRALIDLIYFRGVEGNPWDALRLGRTVYFKDRKEAFMTIYVIGFEEIDIEALKIRKTDEKRTNCVLKDEKAVV
jgi:hypothetical protein